MNNSRIYIIANVSEIGSLKNALQFNRLQEKLKNRGFTVVNPIQIFKADADNEISYSYACSDIKKMFQCEWTYIMSDVSLEKGINKEVKISIDLNLTILHGVLELQHY